ncbi:DNA alkylation repair protein [Rhodopirellula sallentina]|uniref:Heat domain containing protein n=1 Tax=Rhodopirellula sallentina SM41 TaxID=1263870 RepID=M5ULE8_9BACT|nr:DNA alkylation repair protein [Rhodopirellula sallentina]EMI56843.1 heat domain containing protein [Rhodopirellula sallentina SM41]
MSTTSSGTGFSLKDQLFNRERVTYLARLFHEQDHEFDQTAFVRTTMRGFSKLELKERIVRIATTLERFLSDDFRVAAKQITQALPPPLDPRRSDDDFGDFIFAPLGEYVVRNGMDPKHLKLSLRTLKSLTQRFSMEDAIRSFINEYPDETMRELSKWATHSHYHVRRLASEGTRPLLPWSKRLLIDSTAAIPILDEVHGDRTRYVTRSVANHLNDISKSHPDVVLLTLERWKREERQSADELHWMSQHALRTLVKKGDRDALQFLGFRSCPDVEISEFSLRRTEIRPGEAVEFSFVVDARRDERLMVDFVIDFMKANGKRSPKVHKLKQLEVKKGSQTVIQKKHVLRANATTYTLYPGTHQLALQINGQNRGTLSFELL